MKNLLMNTIARAEFAEQSLQNAILIGAKQYVDFNTKLAPYKLEAAENMRRARVFLTVGKGMSKLEIPRFVKDYMSFCNMLGLSYNMPIMQLQGLLSALTRIFKPGSTVVLDHSDDNTYGEMERLLSKCDFRIYEYMTSQEIQRKYLDKYNTSDTVINPIENINFILAVKKGEERQCAEL